MESAEIRVLAVLPKDTLSDTNATLIETVSLSTSSSTSIFTNSADGEALTTVVPVILTFETLVPYLPSDSASPPSQSATATLRATSLPIIPIAAGGGGLVAVILVGVAYLVTRKRRSRTIIRHSTIKQVRPDLDSEFPSPDRSNMGSRTFSRLTFSAPYVVPPSTSSPSIAAPSTVSIGRQYRIVPIRGR
ncbi:hypothetical protein C8R46DRAFT_1113815 [Mycena filopes]|nr:hypothetical protein C8R46DRAFT_1113815 [Mycena filopes]